MPYSTFMLRGLFNSLMYGADKIPDSWFEKVPGGYYKEKKENADRERRRQGRRAQHYSDIAHGGEDDGWRSDDGGDRRGRYQEGDYDSEAEEQNRRGKKRGKSVGASRGDLDGSAHEDPPFAGAYGQTRPYNPAEYAPVRTGEDPYNTRPHVDGRYAAVSFFSGLMNTQLNRADNSPDWLRCRRNSCSCTLQ